MPFLQIDKLPQLEAMPGFLGRFIHSETMTVVDWWIEAGAILPEHHHQHEQIAFLLEGRLELTIEGESLILEPGMAAVIPSNHIHRGEALTKCHVMDIFNPVREDFRQLSDDD